MGKKKLVIRCPKIPLPIFDEDSAVYIGWSVILMLATIWSCINAPLSVGRSQQWSEEMVSFRCGDSCTALLAAVNHIVDLIFFIELFMRFLFPIYDTARARRRFLPLGIPLLPNPFPSLPPPGGGAPHPARGETRADW